MKFISVICLSLVASAVAVQAADGPVAAKSAPAPVAQTSTSVTNLPAAGATNAPAEVPGDLYTNSIGMEFVKVGNFWAGKYEVTQADYKTVMGVNPSQFPGDKHPVDSVSWNDAMAFCIKLTVLELESNAVPKNFFYMLPTESEWQSLVADADLKDAVTSQSAPRSGTSPVGSLAPNSLGLYDVRGNVMEWCAGNTDQPYRVLHGGSWQDNIEINLRPVFRYYAKPEDTDDTFGFRVLLRQK